MSLEEIYAQVLSDNDMELHPNAEACIQDLVDATADRFNEIAKTFTPGAQNAIEGAVTEAIFEVPYKHKGFRGETGIKL